MGNNLTCVATSAGAPFCWGEGSGVGDGVFGARLTPVATPGVTDVAQLAAGNLVSCAVRASGEVWCWGNNRDGALGDGTKVERWTPAPVFGLPGSPVDTPDGGVDGGP